MQIALLVLQGFHVIFLLAHDWVPLGRLNNIAGVRAEDTTQKLAVVTILSALPFAVGLFFSAQYFGHPYPHWLRIYLLVCYAGILLGQIRAWYVPYLLRPDARRAARDRVMFANTFSFLPERNGIAPNALHVALHVLSATTLVLLW